MLSEFAETYETSYTDGENRISCFFHPGWEVDRIAERLTLSPEVQRFIDGIGGYFTQYGLPRVAGRIMGLVMVADRPLTLDDMASALGVSRASISTNIRIIEAVGFVEQVNVPKDRRDYYQFSGNPWEGRLRAGIAQLHAIEPIARRGLAALQEEDELARSHIEDLLDFCEFLAEEERGTIQRWREYRVRRAAEKRRTGVA